MVPGTGDPASALPLASRRTTQASSLTSYGLITMLVPSGDQSPRPASRCSLPTRSVSSTASSPAVRVIYPVWRSRTRNVLPAFIGGWAVPNPQNDVIRVLYLEVYGGKLTCSPA